MPNPEPIKRKPESPWTPERDAVILHLWDAGESARNIAARLDFTISRNGVIGRLGRLNAAKRNPPKERIKRSPADNARSQKSPAHLAAVAAVEMSRTEYDQSPKLFDGVPRTIGTVGAGECRWCSGEPGIIAPLCGHPTVKSFSLCDHHFQRAHTPQMAASAERRAQAEVAMQRSMLRVGLV